MRDSYSKTWKQLELIFAFPSSHKRQRDDKVGGKKPRPAPSESSGEELVIDETTNSSANPESTPSPTGNSNGNPQEWTVRDSFKSFNTDRIALTAYPIIHRDTS